MPRRATKMRPNFGAGLSWLERPGPRKSPGKRLRLRGGRQGRHGRRGAPSGRGGPGARRKRARLFRRAHRSARRNDPGAQRRRSAAGVPLRNEGRKILRYALDGPVITTRVPVEDEPKVSLLLSSVTRRGWQSEFFQWWVKWCAALGDRTGSRLATNPCSRLLATVDLPSIKSITRGERASLRACPGVLREDRGTKTLPRAPG